MKTKLKDIVKWYEEGQDIETFIYNIRIIHRERNRIKTNYLRDKLHPSLQKLFWEFIKRVENETNMVYYGIENSFENKNTDVVRGIIVFQHVRSFKCRFNISYGSSVSKGSGENEEVWIEDDGKIHMTVETPSCHATYGEVNVGENHEEEIFERIKKFDDDIIF